MQSSTLKYIADKLNISISTVSRAVNNKEYVKEETRRRVLEALEEYNYVPNEIARSLKSQSSKTIGVILPDICEVFFGEIIKGIDNIVGKEGYTIIVADTNESKENEAKYLDMLSQKRIDALVFATVDLTGAYVKKSFLHSIPVIFIDNIPNIEDIDTVTIDNAKASKLAVHHLSASGHKSIAGIFGSTEETTGFQRLKGFKDGMTEEHLSLDDELIKYGNYKEQDGFVCMESLLQNRREHPFTAVFVTSEMMTFGAIKAIRAYGLRIPEDISLIGFDIHDKAGLLSPQITTIRQPEGLIGARTGELLLKRLNKKEESKERFEKTLLDPYMVMGESVKHTN